MRVSLRTTRSFIADQMGYLMLILRDMPNPRDESAWEHKSGPSIGQNTNFFVWPADDGPKYIPVKINVTALSDYIGGDGLLGHSGRAETALTKHCQLIQRLAQLKYRDGDFRSNA